MQILRSFDAYTHRQNEKGRGPHPSTFASLIVLFVAFEKYDFRVNAEEMSFEDLMAHIAVSQAFRLAQISG